MNDIQNINLNGNEYNIREGESRFAYKYEYDTIPPNSYKDYTPTNSIPTDSIVTGIILFGVQGSINGHILSCYGEDGSFTLVNNSNEQINVRPMLNVKIAQ